MHKFKTLLIASLLFSGCASTNPELETKEKLLIASDDKKQLIEFYKANLGADEQYDIKLVETYLDMKDIKSAELYARTFSEKEKQQADYIFIDVRIAYQKQRYLEAESKLEAYLASGGEPYQYNLMKGKLKAQQGQYKEALSLFEQSRKLTIDDSEVINNIAVVKMMQQNYTEAMQLLYELYLQNKQDAKIRANLIVASAHANRADIALDALKEKYNEEQAHAQLSILMKSVQKNTYQKNKTTSANITPTKQLEKPNNKHKAKAQLPDKTHSEKQTEMAVVDNNKTPPKFLRTTKKEPVANKHATTPKTDPTVTAQNTKNNAQKTLVKPSKYKRAVTSTLNSVYRIQVLATYKAISDEYLRYLKTNYGAVYAYTHNLWKRYCIGEFSTIEEAKAFLARENIKGAFVVDYTKNRHIKL
ncbi:tetratricopeptide repeat protein [Vibrio sp. JC009]|uniref:tetratricopeptide repeat protein n=1 Tax=Vibrio sp. JC009 TaxID=2912314 RepID=UPI0023B1FB48|nr:tetratricopeptide repeat protein [Vibrio sp. JC009]WED24572.1 tetratricopeptide repeat protein [Vibrio sp. JC009]